MGTIGTLLIGQEPGRRRLTYRIGGALMLVSAALVLLTTLVLDVIAQPHGWHRHAIVYAICAAAGALGVWQLRRRQTASARPLYLSMPMLIALSCAPLLLVSTLPPAMAGVLITLTQLLLVWPNLYSASVLPPWAGLAATATIVAAYAWLVDITAERGRFVAWGVVSVWLIVVWLAVTAARYGAEAAFESLRREATHDPLTGLANRRAFSEFLDTRIAASARQRDPVALVYLDIDHFKSINDRFGHPRGDAVLSWLGGLLGRQVRPGDLASRTGGEEFALVLPGCTLNDAVSRADRMRAAIESESVRWGEPITVSLGVTAAWNGERSSADLMALADQALYAAKNAGRNTLRALPR